MIREIVSTCVTLSVSCLKAGMKGSAIPIASKVKQKISTHLREHISYKKPKSIEKTMPNMTAFSSMICACSKVCSALSFGVASGLSKAYILPSSTVVCSNMMFPARPPSRNRKRSDKMFEQLTPRLEFMPTDLLMQKVYLSSDAKSSANFLDRLRFLSVPRTWSVVSSLTRGALMSSCFDVDIIGLWDRRTLVPLIL